jgi:signal transduction histidine kinase
VILEISKEDFEELKKTYSKKPSTHTPQETWYEKFESLRDQFLWDDRVYLATLDRLLKENPKNILVTLFFNESLVILQNRPELQRLAQNPKVIWASLFDSDQKLLKPATELTGIENFGAANVFPDTDGEVRSSYLVWNNHITMPFRAIVDNFSALHKNVSITKPFLLHFAGPSGTIKTCRLLEWMRDPEKSCGDLSGKYVIVGPATNAVAGATLYQTPVGTMSRSEILANTLITAKDDLAYIPVSRYLLIILIFAHVFLLALAILWLNTFQQLALTTLLLSFEGLIGVITLGLFHLQIPLVPFLIATVTANFAFFWLKLTQQENKRWQAEKKAQYLRELDMLKSNFLSLMSHDLKTPIAKVQALTERLQREAVSLSPEQKEILVAVQKSNDELAQYILSILNFQKIESQELQLNKKSHDINILIDDVVLRLESLAEEKKILIEKELEPMFSIEFDEQLIRQVLTNLIDNAIKYNNEGTVITVRSIDAGDFIHVEVMDNGVGIEKADQAKLFKKFSRSEKGTAERVKGTGLGLYLARFFIELHGGTIDVESELHIGTRFRFTLPI